MSVEFWEILLVDNDTSLHKLIDENINNLTLFGKKVKVLHAHDASEAKHFIAKYNDIAITFIDISLAIPDSGLELVNYIRYTLNNLDMRLIIIDSDDASRLIDEVIEHYDINDFRDRESLETQELFPTVRATIKQYQQFKDLRESKNAIYEKMTTNEITGLPNRLKLSEKLGTDGKKSLILIDIDDFSIINNNKGFQFGDNVLQVFSKFLIHQYAKYAQIFHLEADKFAILCFNKHVSYLERQIAKIKDVISKNIFIVNHEKIHLTATVGIVLDDYGNILQKAEFALKEARLYGKNNVKKYTHDLNILRTIHTNSIWTERIREALAEKRVHAYFQPIQNIQTNQIQKYETLVRIEYQDEIYSPYHFLNAARYSGQLFEIFKLMLKEACKKTLNTPYGFTINVSDYDLKHPRFVQTVTHIIEKYQVDPQKITFEILENNSISTHKEIQKTLNILHDYGCKLAIDDFGSECSNFGQLNNLNIDFIKIDGSYIKDILENKNSQVVAKTILDFAHQKNIPVIAEYVHSKEVYEYVKAMGVDYAQGYEVAQPQPFIK